MMRITDPGEIEHRLLELAYTTDAKITAPVLAYYAHCSIEDAEKLLDNLTARDRISMEIADDGAIFYHVPDRQKLPARPEARAIVPVQQQRGPLALRGGREASPGLAALLSLLVPGAGHIYAGRFAAGVLWFIIVGLGYTLLIPGLFLHLWCVASAAGAAHRLNSSLTRLQLEAG
jgi:TM2 domain-containing membrane protein YozV